jgi:gamma-glutamyltranspeptidase
LASGSSATEKNAAASANYLINGQAPRAGEIFRQPNLARTFRILARGGRDAFYKGEIARRIVDYCQKNGGFISMQDLAAHKSEWVAPISTNYRGYTIYEIPPNGQGLTALIALNILEGFDLASMISQPDRYFHILIEATKLAFQPQGHVQVLVNIIDLGMGLQQALDAPRYRYTNGRSVLLEDEIGTMVIARLLERGHVRASPPGILRSSMGGGQAIMIDPASKTLIGASDPRKDGLALGY